MVPTIVINNLLDYYITDESKGMHHIYLLHETSTQTDEVLFDSNDFRYLGDYIFKKINDVASQNLTIHKTHTDWELLFRLMDDVKEFEKKRRRIFTSSINENDPVNKVRKGIFDKMDETILKEEKEILYKKQLYSLAMEKDKQVLRLNNK